MHFFQPHDAPCHEQFSAVIWYAPRDSQCAQRTRPELMWAAQKHNEANIHKIQPTNQARTYDWGLEWRVTASNNTAGPNQWPEFLEVEFPTHWNCLQIASTRTHLSYLPVPFFLVGHLSIVPVGASASHIVCHVLSEINIILLAIRVQSLNTTIVR